MYNSDENVEHTKDINVSNPESNNKKSVFAGQEVILDNEDDNNSSITNDTVNEKKKISRKLLIGVICIIIVLLCIVAYIFLNKNNIDDEDIDLIEDENELLISEKDTYEGLNYLSQVENIYQLGFFYDYSRNLEGYKIDVSYIKVSGFKDKKLEENLNDMLYKVAVSLYDENSLQDKEVLYEHIYNSTDVYVFNNVLSTLYCKEFCDIEGNVEYSYIGVNVNINNLETIKFEDIFTKNTNILELLDDDVKAKYEAGNLIFSLSPKYIYIPIKDEKIEKISLYDNKDKVAIYKRYANNIKLFDKTYSAIPYAFTTKKFSEKDYYGLVENNLFIDTCNNVVNSSYNEGIKEAADSLYKEAVNKTINLAVANSSKRYLVQIISNIEDLKNLTYKITMDINTYEINKEFFKDSIIEFVVGAENSINTESGAVDYYNYDNKNSQNVIINKKSEILEVTTNSDGEDILVLQEKNTNKGIS